MVEPEYDDKTFFDHHKFPIEVPYRNYNEKLCRPRRQDLHKVLRAEMLIESREGYPDLSISEIRCRHMAEDSNLVYNTTNVKTAPSGCYVELNHSTKWIMFNTDFTSIVSCGSDDRACMKRQENKEYTNFTNRFLK